VIGGNFRLDALQAAVLLVKLEKLDAWTEARQRNARRYDALFRDAALDEVETPVVAEGVRHIFNQYVIRAERRDQLRDHLNARGIGTEIYYPVPLHMQKCFAYLGMRAEECPESARAAASVLAVPIYPELSAAQQEYVVASIAEFYRSE
jgi:dTDP-4-amino-4,6-dideoxygalactose transaminase